MLLRELGARFGRPCCFCQFWGKTKGCTKMKARRSRRRWFNAISRIRCWKKSHYSTKKSLQSATFVGLGTEFDQDLTLKTPLPCFIHKLANILLLSTTSSCKYPLSLYSILLKASSCSLRHPSHHPLLSSWNLVYPSFVPRFVNQVRKMKSRMIENNEQMDLLLSNNSNN